eukprot:maker-scaffold635_size121629-snap-gene-0.8 protein:Tk00930 transcript:maker-scaffold635_size121629-snap-gene-0.8-mRNA-1 annotation:"oxytocin vasopressin receptor-like protein"
MALEIDYVRDFLSRNSVKSKYYIEHKGFRSNHLSHVAIALHKLGASRQFFDTYLEHYVTRLEAPNGPTRRAQNGDENLSMDSLLGRRSNYYAVLDHFERVSREKFPQAWEDLVRTEFGRLAPGLAGSAFHPLIHIGYGASINSREIIVEGLAYLHHSHVPIVEVDEWPLDTFGQGERGFLGVLELVRHNSALSSWLKAAQDTEEFRKSDLSQFQLSVTHLLRHKGQELMSLAHQIGLPNQSAPSALALWVLEQILVVYTGSQPRNDFFLLHGVTSGWALRQILGLFTLDDSRRILRFYVCALLATYLACGSPMIRMEQVENEPNVGDMSWEGIKDRMFQIPLEATDEHIFKLELSNSTLIVLDLNATMEEDAEFSERDTDLAKVEVAIQAIIFILALVSNALVLVALIRQLRRKPSSRMYRLMYHLSIADLLVALLNILPQLIWDITYRFYGPDVLCRVVKFGQVFPIYLSSFILTLMAIDRVGVTKRHGSMEPKPLRPLIQLVWVVATLFSLPQLFIFSLKDIDEQGTYDCWADFGGEKRFEKAYVVIFLIMVFFLPFLVITSSYCVVTYRIWSYNRAAGLSKSSPNVSLTSNRVVLSSTDASKEDEDEDGTTMETAVYEMKVINGGRQASGSSHRSSCKSSKSINTSCTIYRPANVPHNGLGTGGTYVQVQTEHIVLLSKAKRKSLSMTAIVSVCFAVCWLPWCVTMLLISFEVDVAGDKVHPLLVILALLSSLNSTTNPWIYLCFSSAVLQHVKHLVGMRSTIGGPDSLGGADADRPAPHNRRAQRILFKRKLEYQPKEANVPRRHPHFPIQDQNASGREQFSA